MNDGLLGFPNNTTQPATQTEMETGTEKNLRSVSPLLIKQAIDAAITAAVNTGLTINIDA